MSNADFVADTSSKEVWFEVHKAPKEAWVSELEAIEAKLQKRREKEQKGTVSMTDNYCVLLAVAVIAGVFVPYMDRTYFTTFSTFLNCSTSVKTFAQICYTREKNSIVRCGRLVQDESFDPVIKIVR